MDPNLTRWATSHNMPLVAENDTIEANFLYPLKFEPGTDWGYGMHVVPTFSAPFWPEQTT